MTEVRFLSDRDGNLFGFEVFGHSGFDDFGKDIVCSAISSACYLVINTITDVKNLNPKIEVSDGNMVCVLSKKEANEALDLLKGLKLHLLSLESEYPANIQIKFKVTDRRNNNA